MAKKGSLILTPLMTTKLIRKNIMNTKGNGKNVKSKVDVISFSSSRKYKGFKGKCNYCHKTGHRKENCWKLKARGKGNCLVFFVLSLISLMYHRTLGG